MSIFTNVKILHILWLINLKSIHIMRKLLHLFWKLRGCNFFGQISCLRPLHQLEYTTKVNIQFNIYSVWHVGRIRLYPTHHLPLRRLQHCQALWGWNCLPSGWLLLQHCHNIVTTLSQHCYIVTLLKHCQALGGWNCLPFYISYVTLNEINLLSEAQNIWKV